MHVSFFDVLVNELGLKASKGAKRLSSRRWQRASVWITWVLLVVSMAKPVWLAEPQVRELYGRDLLVVADLSGSMSETDFVDPYGEKTSRLSAIKSVLKDFAKERKGDRLGLILFSDFAYLQAPFTADHSAWCELLEEAEVGMAGQSTHLGDAIGLGLKTFQQQPMLKEKTSKEKVMLVLTDGNDTGSLVPPIEAAKIAKHLGVRIYMVAMGDPNTEGESALDMTVLKRVADITGGQAFLAMSRAELTDVHQTIASLEPQQFESFHYQPKESLHVIPLIIIALNQLAMMTYCMISQRLSGAIKTEFRTNHRVNVEKRGAGL